MPAQNRAASDLPARVVIDSGSPGTGIGVEGGDLGEFELGEDDLGGGIEYSAGVRRVVLEKAAAF